MLNNKFIEENGISILSESISSQWKLYDTDYRYFNANLQFNSTDMDSAIKNSEVVFQPTETGKAYHIDQMGDGLKSLFYISLVDSILNVEVKIQQELEKNPTNKLFNRIPPVLTIVALEEPENHISPHIMGRLIKNLKNIANKCNAQTIITSHSPSIVKRIEADFLRYFRLKFEDNTTIVRSITLPDKETQADQYKFVKEAIQAYPELYFAKMVILGEGDSEEIILPKFWETINEDIDTSGISIVPLGGRHVNHFWRLLNDLKIPYITLLDFDKERKGGDWGRIKYVLKQLLKLGLDKSDIIANKEINLTEDELEKMHEWDVNENKKLKEWTDFLEKHHVFFSAPLDIDFLMLEHYGDFYKSLLTPKEGPRFKTNIEDKKIQKLVIEAENEDITNDFQIRIKEGVHSTLKEGGKDGSTYDINQQILMIWYSYFFLQRGKPTTHIEVFSKLSKKEILNNMPPLFKRLIEDVKMILKGNLE